MSKQKKIGLTVTLLIILGLAYFLPDVRWVVLLATLPVWEFMRRLYTHEAREPKRIARAEEELRQHQAAQRAARLALLKKQGREVVTAFEAVAQCLEATDDLLDRAERELGEGAFAPFWDSIEAATNELARFAQLLQQYEHQADQYMNLAKAVDPAPTTVPVVLGSTDHLAIATDVAKRLSDLLGRAQRNFQFAMIFEQRRTNLLLFEGFTTLADALREIPRVIEDSVARVVQSTERLGTMLEGVQTRLEDVKQEIASGSSAAASRERAALAMLDNIQRRRKPGFPGRRW